MKFGYFSVGEGRNGPLETLEHVKLAEAAGFDTVWASDHFEPFTDKGMNAPFVWVWLAAAAERTKQVQLGPGVTAPILRYNPAIVAQAFATLGVLYPGRIFLCVGAGEAVNESPCGYDWPSPRERVDRLGEAMNVIKLLWERKFVSFSGKYYKLKTANLYNKPELKVPLYVGSTGVKVANLAGKYADGFLYQIGLPNDAKLERFRSTVWPSVLRGASEMGRDPATITRIGNISSAYARDRRRAIESNMWKRGSMLPEVFTKDLYDTRIIELKAKSVAEETVTANSLIATSAEDYIRESEKLVKAGFEQIYYSNWGPDAEEFFELMGKQVLPYLRQTYGS